MPSSKRPRTGNPPVRRIPWSSFREVGEVEAQVWGSLPPDGARRQDVERFLSDEGLMAATDGASIVYAYADGPRAFGSPVQSEWYFEFQFSNQLLEALRVEKRLLGP